MFIVAYIGLNLAIVLVVLIVCAVANWERRTHARRLERATERFDALLSRCVSSGDYRLPTRVTRGLTHPMRLEALYLACKKLDDYHLQRVFQESQDAIIAGQYRCGNATTKAFFAYVLSDLKVRSGYEEGYGQLMLRYVSESSVYVRENALKAIYGFGDARLVAEAYSSLSERGIAHNEKLLTDGLLGFAGDCVGLADLLMSHYSELLPCYRNALISFMGYRSIDRFDSRLLVEAQRDDVPCDTLCCIVRKMSKVQSETNLLFLEELLERYREGEIWEPVAVAETGLGKYEGDEEVKRLLKGELNSANWYLRKNAAESLVSVGIDQGDVDDVYMTRDRFAADAINYALWRSKHV